MRPQQQNRRMRGRNNNNNNNNRKGPNPLTRSYESNGPDVKIRGSAQQIAEKYTTLARDATSSGDRVMAENYLQHAEHYNRIIAAAQAQMPIQHNQGQRDDADEDLDDERDEFDIGLPAPYQPQPQQHGQQRNNEYRNDRQDRDRQDRNGQDRGNNGGEQRNFGDRQDRGGERNGQDRQERNDGEQRRDRNNYERRNNNGERHERQAYGNGQNGNGYNGGETAQPQPAPVNPAEAPQPEIEGVPAEIAYNAEQAPRETPRQRRERRPRFSERNTGGQADGEAASGAAEQQPVEVVASAEPVAAAETPVEANVAPEGEASTPAPRRGRRPRRVAEAAEAPAGEGGSAEGAAAGE
ncbi:MAG: DUF4167 domain-containing protein [Methylobacterium mesophilicum]|nr:DUF4167 domain-containing protein [Methylobacterium mesophilicum]